MKTLTYQIMALAITLFCVSLSAYADIWPDPSTGITWTYTVLSDGTASLGGGTTLQPAIPKNTEGTIIVPEYVNGVHVTGLADHAFSGCYIIDSIEFIHPISHVGNSIFYGCENLKSIKGLQYWDMSEKTYLDEIFARCCFLTNIEGLEAWDTSNVEEIGGLFDGCKSLSLQVNSPTDYYLWIFQLQDWNLSSLKIMNSTFANSGISFFYTNWNTDQIEEMNYVFQNCGNLEGVDLSNWNLNNLKEIGHTFENCSKLNRIYLPHRTVIFTKSIYFDSTFSGCSNLLDIDLEVFTFEAPVTALLNQTFVGCTNLTEVRLPNCIGERADYENSYECVGEEVAEIWFKTALLNKTFAGCTMLYTVVGMGLKDNNWMSRYNDFLQKSIEYNPYDVNEDGTVDISDVVKIVNHILDQ